MVLLTLIPGDEAIHTPTHTSVHILSYADGNFTAVGVDDARNLINTRRITAPVAEFAPIPAPTARPAAPQAADPALNATAQRIADLQAEIATLQKKLQAAEQRADETAARAADLLAQPEPAPTAIIQPRIEVRSIHDISDDTLARLLNDGWSILHMQMMPRPAFDEDDRLNVVLQRTVTAPQPQPEQRATAVRTITGTVIIEDDDTHPAPQPALNTLVADAPAADFTRAILAQRLPAEQTLAALNNRLKETARAAFNAAPAPLPYMPLGVTSK